MQQPANCGSTGTDTAELVARRISKHSETTNYEQMAKLYNGMICKAGFVVMRTIASGTEILFIKQSSSGFDGFPKGCAEKTDGTAIATALRELNEETGIQQENIIDIAPVVWAVPRKCFHEVCFFFMCKIDPNTTITVDGDEIVSYKWIPLENVRIHQQMAFVTQSMITDMMAIDLDKVFTCER